MKDVEFRELRDLLIGLHQKIDHLTLQELHMDQELAALKVQVQANTDAEDSAVIVLNGIAAAIAKAIAAGQAAGATPAQLQAISDLQTALAAHAEPLAAAVVAGTAAEA